MASEEKTANSAMTVSSPKSETTQAGREETCRVAPAVDIYETGDGVTVTADLPGVEIDDVDIRVEDDLMTISGRTHSAESDGRLYEEFRLNSFHRRFRLGKEVDQEKITAAVRDGVLTVTRPRAERAKPKQIEVKVA